MATGLSANKKDDDEVPLLSGRPGSLEILWQFSEQEVKHSLHDFPLKKLYRSSPEKSLLYAILCSVYEGIDTREVLYKHLDSMFSSSLRRRTMFSLDVDESLQHGFNEGLLTQIGEHIQLTDTGIEALRCGRLQIEHSSYWMQRILTENVVLATSAIVLIFLSILKFWVGHSIQSNAMVTEGLENFTDLIVVGILALSLKYKKDRLGAIAIIIFMLITGFSLAWGSVQALLANDEIEVSIYAYWVECVSLAFNVMLIFWKMAVGRNSGNLALLSDAKEDTTHLKVGGGVIIGLTFSIFEFYFVDAIVAFAISALVIWEGIMTLRELLSSEEELDIDTIHLSFSEYFDDTITFWILARLVHGPATVDQLNSAFLRGVSIGFRYFYIHAIFGFHKLQDQGIIKNIRLAEKRGLVQRSVKELSITNLGLAAYYKHRAKELQQIADEFSGSRINRGSVTFVIIFIVFFLLIFYAQEIDQFIESLPSLMP
jgi:Co/Zn/Cd efflux system component